MITVQLKRTADGLYEGYIVTGHAEYDAHGKDIVCAAVSAVTLTAAVGLRDVLGCPGIYRNEPGHLEVILAQPPSTETQAVLATMVAGLVEIAHQYPTYLTVSL